MVNISLENIGKKKELTNNKQKYQQQKPLTKKTAI